MALQYKLVATDEEIQAVAALADEIWHEYWPALIGDAQTDYMVKNFQSAEDIARDIAEHNYWYYMIFDGDGTVVGYTASAPEYFSSPDDEGANNHGTEVSKRFLNRLFISKIYLKKEERGKHYASRILEFWNDFSREHSLEGMYLTVNRDNELGVRAYLGRGFEVLECVAAPIGEGFIMDDYIMGIPVK